MKTEEEIRLFLKYVKIRREECEREYNPRFADMYFASMQSLEWVLGEKEDHWGFVKFKQENKE